MGNPAYGKGFQEGKKLAEEAAKKALQNKNTQTVAVSILSAIVGAIFGSRR
jgi:hypothetical protein